MRTEAGPRPKKRPSPYVETRLRAVSLARNERPVFTDLSWTIRAGERWVLIGPNGSGKTQLLKLIAADVWPTPSGRESRTYRWQGQVFTEPDGVKDEIAYVGAERQDKYERYGWDFRVAELVGTGIYRTDIPLNPLTAVDLKRIASILKRFELTSLASRRFLTLSYGQRRLALLARAIVSRPALLLLDELFEGLDRRKHILVSTWLNTMSRSGMPWVLATHRPKDIPRAATHVAALEGGRMAHSGPRALAPQLDGLSDISIAARSGGRRAKTSVGRALLVRLVNASVYFGEVRVLSSISMEVRSGQCWVVHGPNGSGKTTLLRMIYGDHGVAVESIRRFGIEPGVPLERFKRRVGWVSPDLQTDHPQVMTVSEVVQSGRYASVGLNEAPTAADRAAARTALAFFKLGKFAGRSVRELSYGQMRRILFARAWVGKPRLLLLDEPFSGVDTATRVALQQDVQRAILKGVAVVMATHHDDEWPAQVTHELELHDGMTVYCGPVR